VAKASQGFQPLFRVLKRNPDAKLGDNFVDFMRAFEGLAGTSIATGRPGRIFEGNVILPERFYQGQDRQIAVATKHQAIDQTQTSTVIDRLTRLEQSSDAQLAELKKLNTAKTQLRMAG